MWFVGGVAKRSFAADSDEVTPSDDTEAASRRGFGGSWTVYSGSGGGRGRCVVLYAYPAGWRRSNGGMAVPMTEAEEMQ